MSMRRIAFLATGFLLLAMFASAASRSNLMQIKFLDSETRALKVDDNGVPLNCEQVTFDAYCRSTRDPQMTSTLLVQEGDNPPFRITCTIESRYSRCTPLTKGATFEARREKKGITVYFVDDKGKARSQLYKLVDTGGKAGPTAAPVTVAAQPVQASPESAGRAPAAAVAAPRQGSPASAPVVQTAPPVQNSPAPAPTPPPGWVRVSPAQKVKCSFSSIPAGAEIVVDGGYVGNTPSEIGLSTGTHVVAFSMPGFAEWKRELTVESDSAVNVTATLQKAQP